MPALNPPKGRRLGGVPQIYLSPLSGEGVGYDADGKLFFITTLDLVPERATILDAKKGGVEWLNNGKAYRWTGAICGRFCARPAVPALIPPWW